MCTQRKRSQIITGKKQNDPYYYEQNKMDTMNRCSMHQPAGKAMQERMEP